MKPIPPPIVGYCRGTGKPLTAEQAVYVDGFLYSREYAEKLKQEQSPYAGTATAASGAAKTNPDVSPGWAFILGMIPGVGAIYNQQYGKGLLHIVVFAFLVTVLEKSNATAFFVPMLMGWLFYMPFEAYHTAKKRAAGESPEEFSSVIDLPESVRRLPIGPILLILFGTMFLLDNFGLLYLDQFLRFWPVVLIGIGVSMLFHRTQKLAALSSKSELEDSHAER
jgi:hypothetical protein